MGRGRVLGVALMIAAPTLAGIVPSTAAGAQEGPSDTAPGPIEAEGPDPVFDGVQVDETSAVRAAGGRYADAQAAEDEAVRRLDDAEREQDDLIDRSAETADAVTEANAALRAAEDDVAAQERELAARQALAVRRKDSLILEQETLRSVVSSVFTSKPVDTEMGPGTFDQMTVGQQRQNVRDRTVDIQSGIVEDRDRALQISRGAVAAQKRRLGRAEEARQGRAQDLATATSVRDDVGRLLRTAERSTVARRAERYATGGKRHEALVARRRARLLAPVVGIDLTLVDLDAYWRAASTAPCAIPWWLLAGIGKAESGHGTAQGSSVDASGDTTVRIQGIALDGRPGLAAIGDTDGGFLDGDATWDRAVGPMQFIPGTWRAWSADGNGDGTADPNNLYDAAAAAANYLCFGRGELTSESSARGALFAYNLSVPYGSLVLAEGLRYRANLGLPDLPTAPGTEAAEAAGG